MAPLPHYSLQFACLSAKLRLPGDSELIFRFLESSCHLLLPV